MLRGRPRTRCARDGVERAPGPVNIGNPQEITVRELALRIRELTDSRSPLHFTDAAEDDPKRRCPDISLAGRELGWSPAVGIEEGLRRTIAWFGAHTGDPREGRVLFGTA